MITFNPGPSQISSQVQSYMRDFIEQNIWTISHRSSQFTEISLSAREGLRTYLGIPENYKVFYTASASEAMEIIIRSCVISHSHHLVNGAFSKKFFKVAQTIGKHPTREEIALWEGNFVVDAPQETELICLTENETSTWVQIRSQMISQIRKKYPDTLFAVDITSSAGWVQHHFSDADIWFFSVQKCFGLPAGLGILIVNEKALEKSQKVLEQTWDIGAIHSFPSMLKKYDIGQTDETPNVFDVYLLSRLVQDVHYIWIEETQKQTLEKYQFIEQKLWELWFSPFVKNPDYRSKTVYVFECEKQLQSEIKSVLKNNDITIGSGYGDIKDSTLRIANFPSIAHWDLEKLFGIIKTLV